MTQHFRLRVMSAAQRPKDALRRAASQLEDCVRLLEDRLDRVHGREALTEADEELLAAEYDRVRGFDRPLEYRAKEVREFSAPALHWAPPSVRRHRV